MTAVRWILRIVVAAIFLMAGGMKLAGAAQAVEMYDVIGIGQWFRYLTGIIEVGSAVLLFVPSLTGLAAVLLACTMVGAIIVHLTVLHSAPTGPVVLLCLTGTIAWLYRARLTSLRAVSGPA